MPLKVNVLVSKWALFLHSMDSCDPPPVTQPRLLPLPLIQSTTELSKGHYLLWQTVLMSMVDLTCVLKLNLSFVSEILAGGLTQCSSDHGIMGGRKQPLHRSTPHPPSSPSALSPLSWHFPDHQPLQPLGEWTSLLVTALATDEGKLLGPLYVSNDKHGGSLTSLFISSRSLPLSILFSHQNPKCAPAALV